MLTTLFILLIGAGIIYVNLFKLDEWRQYAEPEYFGSFGIIMAFLAKNVPLNEEFAYFHFTTRLHKLIFIKCLYDGSPFSNIDQYYKPLKFMIVLEIITYLTPRKIVLFFGNLPFVKPLFSFATKLRGTAPIITILKNVIIKNQQNEEFTYLFFKNNALYEFYAVCICLGTFFLIYNFLLNIFKQGLKNALGNLIKPLFISVFVWGLCAHFTLYIYENQDLIKTIVQQNLGVTFANFNDYMFVLLNVYWISIDMFLAVFVPGPKKVLVAREKKISNQQKAKVE